MRNTLHQASVAEEYPGFVIDDGIAVAVELGGEHFLGERHADGIRNALPQRTGRRLNAEPRLVLRVTGGAVSQLPKISNLVDRQFVPGQMQQAVQQHRTVAVRQHEAVAIGPARVAGIVFVVVVPQNFGYVGHAHRRAGVSGICGLNGVHAQGTNGVREISPGWLAGSLCFL